MSAGRKTADLAGLARRILDARSILLTTHSCPDGDGIGSLVALGRALEAEGRTVMRVLPDPVPDRYRFLVKPQEVPSATEAIPKLEGSSWDLTLVLDTNQWEMLGELGSWLRRREAPTLFLDHHPQELPERSEVYGSPDAAATGELVYSLIRDHLGWPITPEVAEPIYVAISFDTNSFKYIRSNPASLLIAADLVGRGVDTNKIYRHLFASNSRSKARLLGLVLSSVQFDCEGRLAFVKIPYEVVRELGLERDELRDSITHVLEIQGVEIAATLKEMTPGEVKISLRSKGHCSINGVAALLGGGGHTLAAGCDFAGTVDAAWAALRDPLVEALAHCREAIGGTGDGAPPIRTS